MNLKAIAEFVRTMGARGAILCIVFVFLWIVVAQHEFIATQIKGSPVVLIGVSVAVVLLLAAAVFMEANSKQEQRIERLVNDRVADLQQRLNACHEDHRIAMSFIYDIARGQAHPGEVAAKLAQMQQERGRG